MSDYTDYTFIKDNTILIIHFISKIHIVKTLNAKFPTISRDRHLHGIWDYSGNNRTLGQCIMGYLLLRRALGRGLSASAILKMSYCRGSLLKTNTRAAAGSG